jgi:hypothetical protein
MINDFTIVALLHERRFGKWMRRRHRHEHTDARYFSKLLRARRSGHAATPPSSVMNSPRLMWDMGLPPAQE